MWSFVLYLHEHKRIKTCFLHTFSECANLPNNLSVTLPFILINVYWEKNIFTVFWWEVVLVGSCCAPSWSQLHSVNHQRVISSATEIQKTATASESWSKLFFFQVFQSRTHTSSLTSFHSLCSSLFWPLASADAAPGYHSLPVTDCLLSKFLKPSSDLPIFVPVP